MAELHESSTPTANGSGRPLLPREPLPSDQQGYNPNHQPLPSEVLQSYNTHFAPTQLYAEDRSKITQHVERHTESLPATQGTAPYPTVANDPSFAEAANDLVNKSLDRDPTGCSVVEPDSVLGESKRLYHGYKEGRYFLPNDAAEQDRLDLQHELYRILLGGWLSLVPFTTAPKFVLDVGTGTGIWAQEFAEQNPSSLVVGTDLSAIQPHPRVPNCVFMKSDVEEDEWIFPEPNPDHSKCATSSGLHEHFISFDYIHLRLMFSCFNDPRVVIARAFENLQPGGWIEFQEGSFTLIQANPDYKGDALQRWAAGCIKGAAAVGRNVDNQQFYRSWLIEAGFVDVSERHLFPPFGDWHPDPDLSHLGLYVRANLNEGLQPIGWKMLRLAGMEPDEIDSLIKEARAELMDENSRTYGMNYMIYGRKPFQH
ncbi:S-adenosyl-L-methionine-dependent methyltransferase [Xylariales sp. PMI_506]|nr:S-adenosyl-L-methionine-dependent methyltransferase [Xylariales sp. PMI_506]